MRFVFPAILICLWLSNHVFAEVESTSQFNSGRWFSNLYVGGGLINWANYNEGTFKLIDDGMNQNEFVPSSLLFTLDRELDLEGVAGLRLTERLSLELGFSTLPSSDFEIGPSFEERLSSSRLQGSLSGRNTKIVAEYGHPINFQGIKITTQVGVSIFESKNEETPLPNDAENSLTTLRSTITGKERNWNTLLGLGLRGPLFPTKRNNWEGSIRLTRIFTNRDSIKHSIGTQIIYNFN